METCKTPQDILDNANELYPIPDGASIRIANQAYIQGRLDERKKNTKFITWISLNNYKPSQLSPGKWFCPANIIYSSQDLYDLWQTKK